MKATRILASLALAAGMMLGFTACEDEEGAVYKKLNGKWKIESMYSEVYLNGNKIYEGSPEDSYMTSAEIYFLSDTTGCMMAGSSAMEFSYSYFPATKTFSMNMNDSGRRSLGRRSSMYGSMAIVGKLDFADDDHLSLSFDSYREISGDELYYAYGYEADEDELDEWGYCTISSVNSIKCERIK